MSSAHLTDSKIVRPAGAGPTAGLARMMRQRATLEGWLTNHRAYMREMERWLTPIAVEFNRAHETDLAADLAAIEARIREALAD